jgi:AcrR family transcriptional regulator
LRLGESGNSLNERPAELSAGEEEGGVVLIMRNYPCLRSALPKNLFGIFTKQVDNAVTVVETRLTLNVKDSILNSGMTLLKEKGIAALTQPQVAKAAGVKQSHLTYYFPTRTDLLLGVAERTISTAMTDIAARLSEKPARATLAATLSEIMITGLPPRVFIGLVVAADAEPEIRQKLHELIKHLRTHAQALLVKAGLAASADTALLFHATVVGLAVMHQARLSPESAREVHDGVAAMLQLLALPIHDIASGG